MTEPLTESATHINEGQDAPLRVVFDHLGGPEVLDLVPFTLAPLAPGHVRIGVRAIGLNRFEALFRRDHYVISPQLPAAMGVEGVGVITETAAGVNEFAVGERVAVLPIHSPVVGTGTYATHADIPVEALVRVADTSTDEDEAATWMASLQAYNLATKVPIGSGDTVIVTAATSSVGAALVQIAHDFGASVIATTRTTVRKGELLRRGADLAVAADDEDLAEAVRDFTNGRGATVVYDTVGGTLLNTLLAATAEFGHVLSYGAQTSPDIRAARIDLPLMALDRRSVSFVDLFEMVESPERLAAAKTYIADARRRGALRIPIDRVLDFEEVAEAHRVLESGRLAGKVILHVS
ncbi:zinc-dependent alcohol dehydrogenase family protein [Mycolicibacterium sp. 120266]|uniref:zinc-dependent alcohol dehydrogenase family protein n=1 Tax=Mycolicibacterium sp. 120266 TaxID=3090601 RepID=UPI00299E4AA8|nr:zinc-dependent alcohol dehydrogenase family protein [Mycolicibacterium sp. 120266]MDX1873268.1 zinc-dependent alcohol dehydrogenase family protein [Mycolicibacterium sp. 120266]